MLKTISLTTLALIAFAGNSVLCRLALGDEAIDASSFTSLRLISGILVLTLILVLKRETHEEGLTGSWKASLMLFVYAATFSYAYITLETGVGALILFGSVQITMIFSGFILGSRLQKVEWLGTAVAFAGFAYLLSPGVSQPPLLGFFLMALSGVAWGLYTLLGRGSRNPLRDTHLNFLRTLPFVIVLAALTFDSAELSSKGILLAVLSGGIASGVGYAIWYAALRGLSGIQAAVVQLLVPVIAALGGVLFADEILSSRLAISSAMVLGGVMMVVLGKQHLSRRRQNV